MRLLRREVLQAQCAVAVAILLQVIVWRINHGVFSEFQYIVVVVEGVLLAFLGGTVGVKSTHGRTLHHSIATILIGVITVANFASLTVVIYALLSGSLTSGVALLGSAIAIFFTNVIVYALWYWEIDSPGLTNRRWTSSDKDFQFTQQNLPKEFSHWKPEFIDYLYISVINSLNGANTGAQVLTRQAKVLMATQAIVSIFTLALVVARAVGILSV
ncbi:MAG: hypothetical protein WAS27_01635 [Candidatus Saccharimonadales bacterium]